MTTQTATITWQGRFRNPLPLFLKECEALLRLAVPMTATALVNMGMSVTDVVMMGYIGPEAVAAGAIVSDFYSIIYYFCAGVITVLSPELARAVSGQRRHAVRGATQQGIWIALIVAVFAFTILWQTESVLSVAGIDESIVTLGKGYAKMMALTSGPMMGVALWRNVYGALGLPRVFLIATAIALPMNGAANYLFMFGGLGIPAMGLTGAGLASALVATAMMIGLAIYSMVNETVRKYFLLLRVQRPNWQRLSEFLRVGIPIGLSGFGEVGVFLISTLIAGFFGAEALAAHAITLRLAGIVYSIPLGLSQASTVRIGYAIGKRDEGGLVSAAWTAVTVAVIAGALVCAVLIAGRDVIPGFFLQCGETSTASVVQMASILIVLLSFIQITQGPGTVFVGILRGFKDTKIPMIIILFSFWGVGIATILITAIAGSLHVIGIWIGILCGGAVMAAAMASRLKKHIATLG